MICILNREDKINTMLFVSSSDVVNDGRTGENSWRTELRAEPHEEGHKSRVGPGGGEEQCHNE